MGLVRLLLATCVIASHCGGSILGVPFLPGRQAVLMFYVISGFYMALVLNEKYVGPKSNRVFYVNRYLRLWPSYLAVLAATLVAYGLFTDRLVGWLGRIEGAQNPAALLAATAFANLFIFGQDLFWFFSVDAASGGWTYAPVGVDSHNGSKLLLNPPAFTVGIELVFYLLAPHFLRSYRRVVGVLALSVTYHWVLGWAGLLSLAYSYHFFPATLLFFSLGGLVYWIFRRRAPGPRGYGLLCALFAAILSARLLFPSFVSLVFALAVPGLFELTRRLRADRVLGDLSYPLYIAHWPVLTLLRPHVPQESLGVVTLLLTLCTATVLYLGIERPLDSFRQHYGKRRLARPPGRRRSRGQVLPGGGRSTETATVGELPMATYKNTRKAQRIRTEFETLYSSKRQEGSGVLCDLSLVGAMLDEASLLPNVGEVVRLHLFPGGDVKPVEVSGAVVRVTATGFAVQFKEPSETIRRLLEDAAGVPNSDPAPDSSD